MLSESGETGLLTGGGMQNRQSDCVHLNMLPGAVNNKENNEYQRNLKHTFTDLCCHGDKISTEHQTHDLSTCLMLNKDSLPVSLAQIHKSSF